MDLAVLGMLPEASELFLSLEAGLDGSFSLWSSHEWHLRDWCFSLETGKLKLCPLAPLFQNVVFSVYAKFVLPSISRSVILGERRAGPGGLRIGLWLQGAPSTNFLAVRSIAAWGNWSTFLPRLCSISFSASGFLGRPHVSSSNVVSKKCRGCPVLFCAVKEVCSAPGMLQEQKAQHPGPGQP